MENEGQEVKAKKAKKVKHAVEGQEATPGNDEPKVKKERVRTSKNYDQFSEITLNAEKNPKREGSKSHTRFALYRTGMTVSEFIKEGGTFGDLAWDSQRSHITVSAKPGAEVTA